MATTEHGHCTSTRQKLYFIGKFICNVTFQSETKMSIIYWLRYSRNLFDAECMELFKIWDTSINVFWENIVCTAESSNEVEQVKQKYAKTISKWFSEGLSFCTKTNARITVSEKQHLFIGPNGKCHLRRWTRSINSLKD